jgi:O-antigen ligase
VLFVTLIKNKRVYLLSLIGLIVFISIIVVPTGNPTIKRFQSAFKPEQDASYIVRLENQRIIRPYIWRHPFGGGLGATGVWGARFAPGSFLAGFPTDSGYVRVAVELGWIGLTIYLLLWIVILKKGIDHYYSIRDAELKFYILSMVCVLFSLYVVNYAQQAVVQLPTSLLFWVAAAIISRGGHVEIAQSTELES